MTYWFETSDDPKDMSHWLGIAISLAKTIGLHRDPGNSSVSTRKKKLRKRIWWSCFVRDRLIALGTRRPLIIGLADCDMAMLQESDFDIETLDSDIEIVDRDSLVLRNIDIQRQLASMFVAQVKLCLCVGQILQSQYSSTAIHGPCNSDTMATSILLRPTVDLENLDMILQCDLALTSWDDQHGFFEQDRKANEETWEGPEIILVHQAMLQMIFHATIFALHRPVFLAVSPGKECTAHNVIQELSRMKAKESACQITNIVDKMLKLRLMRYLPATSVTVLIATMMMHLLEMKCSSPKARDRAIEGYRQCSMAMEELKDVHVSADFSLVLFKIPEAMGPVSMGIETGRSAFPGTASVHHDPVPGIGTAIQTTEMIVDPKPYGNDKDILVASEAVNGENGSETDQECDWVQNEGLSDAVWADVMNNYLDMNQSLG